MSKRFVIRWKSKVNGRIGQGSRVFERQEAEHLVSELNVEYPEIEHDLLEAEETQPLEGAQRGQFEGNDDNDAKRDKAQRSEEHALTE